MQAVGITFWLPFIDPSERDDAVGTAVLLVFSGLPTMTRWSYMPDYVYAFCAFIVLIRCWLRFVSCVAFVKPQNILAFVITLLWCVQKAVYISFFATLCCFFWTCSYSGKSDCVSTFSLFVYWLVSLICFLTKVPKFYLVLFFHLWLCLWHLPQ